MAVPHHQAIIMEAESAMAAENVRKNIHIVDIVLSCEEEAIRQVEKLRKLMESGNGLEDNMKRENWPTGRITSVLTGSDRLSRIVQVKTTKGTFIRPMARFYLLEAADTG
ncbi:hypothetical protein T03_6530 [Trichinella britovi]|uniref:DUF5641 domain-containing protein n=1 Tax=Trichinella britovi TaxID=45882 RepID=A0A0V1CGJ0_TRIBR|nr:hypothetical protein T03_6530 [Trichinella britovi]